LSESEVILSILFPIWSAIVVDMNVQMDQAGRVVLPKKLRERFRLQGGDTLVLEVKGDEIHLRPQKPKGRLERVNGVLVLVSEMSVPEGPDLVSDSRGERIDQIARNASGLNEGFLRHECAGCGLSSKSTLTTIRLARFWNA
jgi:AbrB family looped-hinge helix DNA binding protein